MNYFDWHQRFLQQAQWSRSARSFFFSQINLSPQAHILEVGCGTGAVLSELVNFENLFGVDLDFSSLACAKSLDDKFLLTNTDGRQLPFQDNRFDLTFCHYLLLWITNPNEMLREMQRVTRPGGWVCLFAEPDYAARIDSPMPLDQLGFAQNKALAKQGVNLTTGRQLTAWLTQIELESIQSGILGGHWTAEFVPKGWQMEWETIYHDLEYTLDPISLSEYKKIDRQAYRKGSRVLFIPTFYAWGQKKK